MVGKKDSMRRIVKTVQFYEPIPWHHASYKDSEGKERHPDRTEYDNAQ